VKYGQTTGRINVILDTPGKIVGTITDTYPGRVGLGMNHVPVALSVQNYCYIDCLRLVYTNSDGYYEIPGLKPYPWFIWVNLEQYGGYEHEPVPTDYIHGYRTFVMKGIDPYTWFPASGDQTAINVKLEYNGFINLRGRVVNGNTHEGISGLTVTPGVPDYDQSGNPNWWLDESRAATTDGNGYFTISGLDEGNVILFTDGQAYGQEYYSQYYDNEEVDMGARTISIVMGETKDMTTDSNYGEWELQPISP